MKSIINLRKAAVLAAVFFDSIVLKGIKIKTPNEKNT